MSGGQGADGLAGRRRWRAVMAAVGAAWCCAGGAALHAQAVCTGSNISYFGSGNDSAAGTLCAGQFYCQAPRILSTTYTLAPGCDPTSTTCGITATVAVEFTGNHNNSTYFGFGYSFEEFDLDTTGGSLVGECGYAGEELTQDFGTAIVTGSVQCGTPSAYTLNVISCPTCPSCGGVVPSYCTAVTPVTLNFNAQVNCPTPPPEFCSEGGGAGGGAGGPGAAASGAGMAAMGAKGNGPDSGAAGTTGNGTCRSCQMMGSSSGDGSGCGASAGGGGASCTFKAAGAHLRYGGGGVGGASFPGSTGVTTNPWNTTLGRNWSHDYAERIVMAPDQTHVWLLTRFGSFREFGSLAAGSGLAAYQTVTPADEYRTLYYNTTTQGWQLQGLDGSVEYFLGQTAGALTGFLDKITDRLYDPGNPTAHPPVQAAYNAANQLDHVTFPDGRRENFTYSGGASGKLAALTELGTDGTTSRTWTFSWSGDDLTAIGRPDICAGQTVGTSWNFTYGDPAHPGYLTQVLLTDCNNNSRVEAAFVYDSFGNVAEEWRGDPSFSGSNATDAFNFSFDSGALPAVTTLQTLIRRTVVGGVNHDVVQTGTYTLGRDPGRSGAAGTRKVRVVQVTGECPSCGTVANPALTYGDNGNPLLPTVITDGRGVSTNFTYDANGRQLTRVETVQTTPSLIQRQTTWTYSTAFPAFVASVTGPFSPPGAPPSGTRAVARVYDAKGNLQTSTATGSEATYPGGHFSLQTAYSSYSAAGLPGLVNPPDTPSTTADATAYTFQAGASNGFLIATRLDPVTGAPPLNAASSFQYDAFNRLTDVTDVNGVTTHTTYDALNRVLAITQGYGTAQALTTVNTYDALGDLICAQLPAGNATAYGYDSAGRPVLTAVQASCAAQPSEQLALSLDAVGHRTQELRQRIVGGSPVTDATSLYSYTTSCHLDSMTTGDPSNPAVQSTTQFAYDCNDNLTSVWDPNHNQPAAASTTYAYDPLNRRVQVVQPWGGSGGGSSTVAYAYDLQNHLVTVADSERNQTSYVLSDRDLQTSQSSPASGLTTYSYDDHGQLIQQTDARGIVTNRQLDPANRVLAVSYPSDPTLTTAFTYDTTTAVGTAPVGRLSSITKGSTTLAFTYDVFGRKLQDGAVAYSYDGNGNIVSIAYPGNVTACYSYDAADRQAALSYATAAGAAVCQGTTIPVITSTLAAPTVYSAGGPLQVLHLANGVTETHAFDQRYYPTAVSAGTLLAWTYATDGIGNVISIAPGRTYAYQDYQYFLTQANAPSLWGTRTWLYDTLGNRLSENRGGGATDTYTYFANGASPPGDTPRLKSVALAGAAGTRTVSYDAAGNVVQESGPTAQLDLSPDAAGRLSRMSEEVEQTGATLTYDGRGFLASANGSAAACGPLTTTAAFGSDGTLYYRQQQALLTGATQAQTRVFYFARRPVAQLDGPPATGTLTYLSVDHLGAPNLASTGAGLAAWSGGFEPFGRDYTTPSALSAGIFLRLPGQWDDAVWDAVGASAGLYYNLNRWYEDASGRYTQPDPLGNVSDAPLQLGTGDREWFSPLYSYADSNPESYVDPLGQLAGPPSFKGCDTASETAIGNALFTSCGQVHGKEFASCMCNSGNPSIASGLSSLCDTARLTVRCVHDGGGSCSHACAWSIPFGRTIRLCPPAWLPARCGPLGCTLMHELTHMLGHFGERWPQQTEKCLGCS